MSQYSSQYTAAFVAILATLAPHFVSAIGQDTLTSFITTGVALVAMGVVMYKRYKSGGINLAGKRI